MTWLAIIFAVLAVYGSVLMVRPSKREKRLAGLRQAALKTGLELRLGSRLKLPETEGRSDLMCLMLNRESKVDGASGVCQRSEAGRLRSRGNLSRRETELESLWQKLPEGVEVLVSGPNYVAACWDERGGSEAVDSIRQQLSILREITEQGTSS